MIVISISTVVVYMIVWLVLGSTWLGGGREEAGRQTRWVVSSAWQLRWSLHSQPQLPVTRSYTSYSHWTLQR